MINRIHNTVIVLEDNLPENNISEIAFIKECISNSGYTVKSMNIKEFIFTDENYPYYYGDVLIVPNCRNLPTDVRNAIKHYNENHGSVLFIGGPLYYNCVKENNGIYETYPLENTLDANFALNDPYIRSGIAPSYKVFCAKRIVELKTISSQNIYSGDVALNEPSDIIIPCETNHGVGFDTNANCRFIPLVECYEDVTSDDITEIGLRNGNRGSFAFIELENTQGLGFCGRVNYGMVETTQVGSAVAQIGYNGGIQNLSGAKELLLAIIKQFKRGIYLFEAGCNGIRFRENESVVFGAKILNTASRFKKVSVIFEIEIGNLVYKVKKEKLVSPKNISDISFDIKYSDFVGNGLEFDKDYKVKVSLIDEKDCILDEIESLFSYETVICDTEPQNYVCTRDDKFFYKDKPWYMAGINYWPTFSPSKEKGDYWFGFCDSSNYDPITVEQDLDFMEKVGINCVLTRFDFADVDRAIHGLRDFIWRCKCHNIKIGLSMAKVTATRYYDAKAIDYIFSKVNIGNNPTIAFVDVEWESCVDTFNPQISAEFNDEWCEWLTKKYGSLEQAEKTLDIKLESDIFGYKNMPERENLSVAADMIEFADESINSYWGKIYPHLKGLLPNQMITFRFGTAYPRGKAQAVKYIDFSPVEIYGFNGFEDFENPECRDNCVGLCVATTAAQSYETGNKPIVWAEYGRSACGIKWLKQLFYDHENSRYYDREVKYQRLYNEYVQQAVIESNCAGTAPWWWCGGFRYTELADFGYVTPSGKLTDSGKSYIAFCKDMKVNITKYDDREEYVCKKNIYELLGGKNEFIEKYGIKAYKEAKKDNKRLVINIEYK